MMFLSDSQERTETAPKRLWTGHFPHLLAGQVLVNLGDHLMSLTMTVVIFRLFGTGAALGTYFVCRSLPAAILGPLAGVFVDRYNRRTVALLATCLSVLVAAALPSVHGTLGILVGVLLVATAGAIVGPAMQAALPQIVARENLLAANSAISAVGTANRLVGPAVSALLVAVYGPAAGFYAAAGSYLLAAVALCILRLPSLGGTQGQGFGFGVFMKSLWEGLRFLAGSSLILWVTIVTTVVMFADSCVAPLFTLLLQREMGTPPEFIGYLSTAFGVGIFLGSLLLPVLGRRIKETRLLSIGALAVGLQMLLYSTIHVFGLALPLQVISGFGFAFTLNAVRTLFQVAVPGELIGRAVAAATALSAFLNLFAFKAGGYVADASGVRTVFLVAGLLTLVIGFLSLYFVDLARTKKSEGQATQPA